MRIIYFLFVLGMPGVWAGKGRGTGAEKSIKGVDKSVRSKAAGVNDKADLDAWHCSQALHGRQMEGLSPEHIIMYVGADGSLLPGFCSDSFESFYKD